MLELKRMDENVNVPGSLRKGEWPGEMTELPFGLLHPKFRTIMIRIKTKLTNPIPFRLAPSVVR